jgi:hypothetical protein
MKSIPCSEKAFATFLQVVQVGFSYTVILFTLFPFLILIYAQYL